MHSFEVSLGYELKALIELHFQHEALSRFIENVLRSTLSYPNETSKECIQFLNVPLPHILIIHAKCEICLVKKSITNVFDLAIKGQGQSNLILGGYYFLIFFFVGKNLDVL